jgi:hypothetical protein
MNWLGLLDDLTIALALFIGLTRIGRAIRGEDAFRMGRGRGY